MTRNAGQLVAFALAGQIGQAVLCEDCSAQSPVPQPFVVYCYDRERDVVSRELAGACHGMVIDESKAAAIKARRDQAVARSLEKQPHESFNGHQLASAGTAFYVDEGGELVTNYHVVADCDSVEIRFDGRLQRDVRVIAVDAQRDLALLHAEPSPAFAWFRSSKEGDVGNAVVTVGFPDQGLPTLVPIATPGTLLRTDDGLGHIIINADIHHGNSGSPILDSEGLVIGMVNAKLNIAQVYAKTGKEVEDTGIGVATSAVIDFLQHNNARFHVSARDASRNSGQIFELARSFVARAECWR